MITAFASGGPAGETSSLTLLSQWGLQPDFFRPFDLNHTRPMHHYLHDAEFQ
jgi:hypothetical protein